MTDRFSTSTPANTSSRVKAFRERLAESSYKRIEGYITVEEKSRLERVKSDLGVTSDVAVAGLIRLGLEAYAGAKPASTVNSLRTASLTSTGALQALSCPAGTAEFTQTAVANSSALNAIAAPAATQPCFSAVAPPSTSSPCAMDNPIAHFFKSRKETT